MSDIIPPPPELPPTEPHSVAAKERRHTVSAAWIIPVVAALIAGYLGVRSYVQHGPTITISFNSAEGLSAGQTAVKYKYVTLGTVEKVTLNEDMRGVQARVRMNADTDALLTDHARFWVEKPRLGSTNLSDIVSGTYIEVDPGAPDGEAQTEFTGLENQPSLPADEPGTSYTLSATRLGAVSEESPVYYRDINVGKVLGYDVGDGLGPITVQVFVRAPYDKFVKSSTHFWDASGLSVKLGGGGVHLEMHSLQSVLGGGIEFETPKEGLKQPQADTKTSFTLYEDHKLADAAGYSKRLPCVTYLKNPVKDLAVGSPVQIFGIDVGDVTNVKLVYDPQKQGPQVRVAFEIEPDRAFGADPSTDAESIIHQLVANGMRVKMGSSDLIMGQEVLSLEFAPKTQQAENAKEDTVKEGDAIVLPGQGGDIDNLANALGDVAAKLDQIPFDQIGQHLNHLLATADSADMNRAVHSLAATLDNAKEISQQAKQNLTPALQRLPDISAQLQTAVTQANAFMASVNKGYGQDSDFQRDTKRTLDEANEAARSIRLLADYLEKHPEALIQGKTPDKGKP